MTKELTNRRTYTIEEVRSWLNDCNSVGIEPDMAWQLERSMRRESKLYDALHDLHSLYAGADRTLDELEVIGEVQELLYGDNASEYSSPIKEEPKL